MEFKFGRWIAGVMLFVLFVVPLVSSCGPFEGTSANVTSSAPISATKDEPTKIIASANSPSRPTEPISVDVSFPNGAPALNQTNELRVIVKTRQIPAKAMSVQVNLPDSFELSNGSLSWIGDIPVNSEVTVIKAMVKSIKLGSWTIEVTSYLDPKENSAFGGTGHNPIYVLVSESSAEWRLNPPYGPAGTSTLPPGHRPQLHHILQPHPTP